MKKGEINYTLKVIITLIAVILLIVLLLYLVNKSLLNGVFNTLR